jgi:hypothetical protein
MFDAEVQGGAKVQGAQLQQVPDLRAAQGVPAQI